MSGFILNNAIICACAFLGFSVGGLYFFKPKKAVYGQMIVWGLFCIAIGRLYQIVRVMTIDTDIFNKFQMGDLGVLGSFMFFFTANYGLMDSLADDRSRRFRKHRLIALAAPVTAILFCLFFCVEGSVSRYASITSWILTALISLTSYLNLKHIILPDVDFGIINCLKLCNGSILAYSLLCLAERAAYNHKLYDLALPVSIAMGLVILLIVPFLIRGYKKWTT